MRDIRFLNALLPVKHPLQDRQYARTEHCNAFPIKAQKQPRALKPSFAYSIMRTISCGLLMLLAYGQAVAAVQCSPAETSNFQAQCNASGADAAGQEAYCLSLYPDGYYCGHYPLPSRVHPIPMGLGCEVIWIRSPSGLEGPIPSTTTDVLTLACSSCPTHATADFTNNNCKCDPGYVADQAGRACVKGLGKPVVPPLDPAIKPDKNNSPTSCSMTGNTNPINIATGLKYQTETDYHSPTGLEFKRTYNSLSTDSSVPSGSLGAGGWRLEWQRSIQGMAQATYLQSTQDYKVNSDATGVLAPNGTTVPFSSGGVSAANAFYTTPATAMTIDVANVIRGAGKVHTFKLVNGVWQSDGDITEQLTSQFDAAGGIAGWTYTTADKDVEQYNPAGELLSITDRNGKITTFTYSDGTLTAPNGGYLLDATGASTTTLLPAGLLIRITDAF
ncbi:MAG: DUF6531 domain-containing protein, partial [Gallionella sp.]